MTHAVQPGKPLPEIPETMKCKRCGQEVHRHFALFGTVLHDRSIGYAHIKFVAGGTQPILCGPLASE